MTEFQRLREKVRRCHELMQEPEFGLLSWRSMYGAAVRDLHAELCESKAKAEAKREYAAR